MVTVLEGAVRLTLTRQRTFYAESSIGERVERMCILKQQRRHRPGCFLELHPAGQSRWVPIWSDLGGALLGGAHALEGGCGSHFLYFWLYSFVDEL